MSGVAEVLRNIVRELPYHLEKFYEFLHDVTTMVLIPAAILVTSTIVAWKLAWIVWRILFPPAAAVLHKEALGLLKKGDDRRTVRQAERMLQKAVRREPTFKDAYLSLASLQLFQKDSPQDCLKTIDRAFQYWPEDPELVQLQMDAQAVEQNMGHMVKAGSVTVPYLGDVPMK